MLRGAFAATAAAVVFSVIPAAPAPAADPRVFVVVVDGLEPEDVTPVLTPNLQSLIDGGEARVWTNAQANMVTETNANHVAMMSGAFGETSGLVANGILDTSVRPAAELDLDRPSLNLAETLFDRIEAEKPALVTAAVMGKAKLRDLFDCTPADGNPASCGTSTDNPEGLPVTHVRPDHLVGATESPDVEEILAGHDAPAEPATGSGYTLDNLVTEILVRLVDEEDPHLAFVNLGGVDGQQHLFGAKSLEGRAAVLNADLQIGRLVTHLRQTGKWAESILVVTADHSFQATGDPVGTDELFVANQATPHVTGTAVALDSLLGSCDGVTFETSSHSGSASVYLTDASWISYSGAPLSPEQETCLATLRERALANPNVAEALYRLENPQDPGHTIAAARPDWNLDTPRIGELLLTAKDGAWLVDTRTSSRSVVAGNHGGPSAIPIPFVVASGRPGLVTGTDDTNLARPVDIAPTVACLLGVGAPAQNTGRVLTEAFPACSGG